VIVAPRVAGREGAALVVFRSRPHEPLPTGGSQGLDGAVQALLRKRLGLSPAGPETGTPEQAFGLLGSEFAFIDW
jgi:hypothetical protein